MMVRKNLQTYGVTLLKSALAIRKLNLDIFTHTSPRQNSL